MFYSTSPNKPQSAPLKKPGSIVFLWGQSGLVTPVAALMNGGRPASTFARDNLPAHRTRQMHASWPCHGPGSDAVYVVEQRP